MGQYHNAADDDRRTEWKNVSIEVSQVIEKELNGKFSGDGWRDWKRTK